MAAGLNHFRDPEFYLGIVPPSFPVPGALVTWSGVAEVALGLAVLVPAIRSFAGWGIVAMLVAFLLLHVYMALNPGSFAAVPEGFLWARLPLQVALMYWAWWATRAPSGAA